ncbi:MAG: hypothetical protein N5P05_003686 [Chroococcopsis gigantea SAG 12.99]|jgi:hypothetical protein|nr:hypothetical protein [Chroococcopsis gigantea SAG 12.99]
MSRSTVIFKYLLEDITVSQDKQSIKLIYSDLLTLMRNIRWAVRVKGAGKAIKLSNLVGESY